MVLRTEFAWFRDEAFFRAPTERTFPGKGLTPRYVNEFLTPVREGKFDTVVRNDTLNFMIGWDTNQYIRSLNATQSFFFSGQFFVRHTLDPDPLQAFQIFQPNNPQRFIPIVQTSLFQTFLVNTTYAKPLPLIDLTVQITPSFTFFYDWQGMMLFQPAVRFVRDPWRFLVDFTQIDSGVFRSSVGLVRDRSNVRMQIEYVL